MSSADDNAAHGRSQKARRPRPKFRTHNIVKLRPDNDFGFRGADPGTEPSTEFPCQSWKCPQGRGNLGSAELQVEMACHASSRAWAAAAVQGQDAVDQLCNATVTLAVADKAIELWECVGGRKADSRNYWVSARRQYDNCVPEDVQEWRAGLPALVQQAYNLALAKRATLPALKDIEPGIVGAIELLYTRHEDAKSLWLECPRSVPLDLGPYANAHESAVEYVYAFRGGSCVQEPYVHAFRDGKMVRLPLPEAPTSEQTQDPGADKEANRYM